MVPGTAFRHLTYFRDAAPASRGILHVYIEHDGTPWSGRFEVSADPTPRVPLMLDLMRQDDAAVLFLGRPCYFEVQPGPPCHPLHWTHRRYAPEIVDSMAAALRFTLARHRPERLVLIGHSGGGTLAVLLAERFPDAAAVVTLGANLDIEAWASLHDHSPLLGSLNPAHRPALPPTMRQWHLAGSADRDVPPGLLRSYARGRADARVIELDGIDHACCWAEVWPAVLAALRQPTDRP